MGTIMKLVNHPTDWFITGLIFFTAGVHTVAGNWEVVFGMSSVGMLFVYLLVSRWPR